MKRVVVVGGGFAGSYVAKTLEKEFDVTLIDTKDYFEFTPGVLRTIVEPNHLKKMQSKHKDYLKKAKIVVGCVDEIGKTFVKAGKRKLRYDYLAICSGSNYNPPIKEQGVVIILRASHLKAAHKNLKKAKRVLIIGGGLVGVELTAEICTHYPDKKIVLAHSGGHLTPRNNRKTSDYSERFFKKYGVELVFNEIIKSSKGKVFIAESGRKIKADMAFFSTGIKPNFEFMQKNFPKVLNEANHIIVDENLRMKGQKNVFAAGDINSVVQEKTAQNSEWQAKIVARNIIALENGKELEKYDSRKTLLIISLGKYDGIFEYKNIVFHGKIPAFLKWAIERWVMWRHS